MRAFGQTDLTIEELPDELQFRVDSGHGWFMMFAFPGLALAAVLVSLAVPDSGTAFGIALTAGTCLLVSAILTVVSLKQGTRTTTLSVTSGLFEARGAGLGAFYSFGSGRVVVQVVAIRSLGYAPGGDGEPSGFEVRCGSWKGKVLLPGLNRHQTRTVTDAILRRFPEIGSKARRTD
jgi:hypothetical protein